MTRALTFVLLLAVLSTQAQWLTTYRNASLKQQPQAGAATVPNSALLAGDRLELLDSGVQQNAHYHVRIPGTSTTGYIYRSQVRRMEGAMPLFEEEAASVEVTVIDVGPGLACLIRLPGNRYIIYDAGFWGNAHKYIAQELSQGTSIEKLILSHTDADHWGSVVKLAEDYQIKEALLTTYRTEPNTTTLNNALTALAQEPGMRTIDLVDSPMEPGTIIWEQDEVRLTFVSGFGQPPADWHLSDSHMINAVSIVIRLDYRGTSVLFTGDAVGVEDCGPGCNCPTECVATEAYMLDHAPDLLDVDVLIAPHHGAYNGSCREFIYATSPEYVIFSAGNMYRHPRALTVERFLEFGLTEAQIFRTDRGKKQPDGTSWCSNEWDGWDSTDDGEDESGDDHVRIQLTSTGRVLVGYEDN